MAWWKRWGRSEPAGSFYKRDFSGKQNKNEMRRVSVTPAVIIGQKILNRGEETHQLFIAEGGGRHGGGDSSLTGVLN